MQRVTKEQAVSHEQLMHMIECGFVAPYAEITYHRDKPTELVNFPTLHEASDWLWDTHGVHVSVQPMYSVCEFIYPDKWFYILSERYEGLLWRHVITSFSMKGYHESYSAAITHALTILKERIKQKI